VNPEPSDDETKHERVPVAKRPTTYVALFALAVATAVVVVSANHDFGADLPPYALELPLLLHIIHGGVAFAIVAFIGNWVVQNLLGHSMEEGGLGPFRFAFGKTSQALRELRDAVEKLDDKVEKTDSSQRILDERLTLVQRELAEGTRFRTSTDGEEDDRGGGRPRSGSGETSSGRE
jgi:hypothetical protein